MIIIEDFFSLNSVNSLKNPNRKTRTESQWLEKEEKYEHYPGTLTTLRVFLFLNFKTK